MASSFSTDLKLELMATGENSGTWGTKTNTNLDLVQQAIAGFEAIAITSTNTTLLMTDAQISTARNAVIKFKCWSCFRRGFIYSKRNWCKYDSFYRTFIYSCLGSGRYRGN